MDLSAKHIHLIDDDTHSIEVLKFILKRKGYQVRYSLSGSEAIQEFETYQPDLILLDVIMPEMDGYEVCRYLKTKDELKDIPVIFITASHQTKELVKGFEAGAVDFISKPINKPELLARVQTHLDLKQSRDMLEMANAVLLSEVENRKQAEEKFRALSETAFEAVLFVDNNTIIEANNAAMKLFSIQTDRESPLVFDFVENENIALLEKIFKTCESGPWELDFLAADGRIFNGQVQHQPVKYKGRMINVLAIRDVTRQKELEKEVLNAIIETQEKERKRFSRDLHDGLGAILSTLKIYMNLLQKENKTVEERETLIAEMKETINYAVESARTIANNIMPSVLMDHGLMKALKSFTNALNKTGTVVIDFQYPENLARLPNSTETHLYRIALELINNTLRHGQAHNIGLRFSTSTKGLVMDYWDDGKGFDFEKIYNRKEGGQGLKNIFSRINFMDGKGFYHSESDKKLAFHLEIPL